MKLKNILYIILLLGALGLFSCVEDKGSYEHLPVNEITVSGLEKSYSVLAGITELEINPIVEGTIFGKDDSNYEYTWYVCESKIGTSEHKHTVIGNEKKLKTTVTLNPGTYKLYLIVKDLITDMEWIISDMSLTVTTSLARGFYVLGEDVDGGVAMDFLSMPVGEDTTIIRNIFNNTENLKGPHNLIFTGNINNPGRSVNLWLVTDDGSYLVESSIQEKTVFEIDKTYKENFMFPSMLVKHPVKVLEQFPHQAVGGSNIDANNRGIISEDGIFAVSLYSGEIYPSPINRYSQTDVKLFRPYPMAFCNPHQMLGNIVFYDMDSNAFVYLKNTSTKICAPLLDKPGDVFMWKQDKRTIVFGENNPAKCFALMKSTENDEDYFIYEFTQTKYTATKTAQYELKASELKGFSNASFFSFPPEYPVMIYAAGNTLYQYNYVSKQCREVQTFEGEITYSAFEWASRGELDIAVCTFNPSAEQNERGTIYKFIMDQSLEITPVMYGSNKDKEFVFHTPLKIKKLEYRNCAR